MKASKSPFFGYLLNLLLPGLGHLYFKEYVFGLFVFLVTLMAVALFIVSYFLDLPVWSGLITIGLPIVFYLFTFVDLNRTATRKKSSLSRGRRAVWIFLIAGVVYQVLAPVAPLNFCLRNFPEYFIQKDNRLSPLYNKDSLLKASSLAYAVDIAFIERPIMYALPDRYDIVRIETESGERFNGIVLGLPGEEVQAVDGVVVINGMPDFNMPPGGMVLQGDCPLTYVGGQSILVAVLNLGSIDKVYEAPLDQLVGKVDRAF